MQEFANTHSMRNAIISQMAENGLEQDCYIEMLDYTISLFETQGLGREYFGYHNINHELEVTYISLLASNQKKVQLTDEDKKYLYAAALFHDFDPQKNVDKPHEESVIRFISLDKKLQELLISAKIDLEIIKVLILRTTYPWSGETRKNAEAEIKNCFERSEITKNDLKLQQHFMDIGWYLSLVDRISGYLLGDFTRALELAKMNAHALAWRPSVIIRTSVAYFEEVLNKEASMSKAILRTLPKEMRKNFFDTILSFMKIRQQEVTIQANYSYENLKLIPTIENQSIHDDVNFAQTLYDIFLELPKPLQFGKENFKESIKDPETIINTLRLNDNKGEIIGFSKGGPLEKYQLREEIRDENYGLKNTIFLEPLALKMGYWGLRGGSEMRHMFIMQAHSRKYKYMTSFALRDVIRARITKEEAEFVQLFDPERWDYYRVKL
ncbi:MAG: HD domain-containing protein [Crenarchaeota archaeon]|nr:HD domain-containing protein [Thermoproteota archaeon]HJJ21656.1 HD domain-containing protein [Nitrosopumilus sp.]MDA0853018.1 HD domain-containing protein [Thermoproteota archaeon]MDA1123367.1 HD domain-containing protein [Thermoproteota archaeon]HJJ23881.1 HD domain-containing protein [Nitrosopumilus sp.]